MPRLLISLAMMIAMLAGACTAGETQAHRIGPADAASTASDVPAVDVIDVRTGDTMNLQSLVPGDTPVLFWFWAPH